MYGCLTQWLGCVLEVGPAVEHGCGLVGREKHDDRHDPGVLATVAEILDVGVAGEAPADAVLLRLIVGEGNGAMARDCGLFIHVRRIRRVSRSSNREP